MSEQPSVTLPAISTIKSTTITLREIVILAVVAILGACEFSEATPVAQDSAGYVESIESSDDRTLTKNELSFLLTLNASEQADITELLTELADWDFQQHQLEEVLRDFVAAREIGLSKRTPSGSQVLTDAETDELLATFTNVDESGYFLFLTDTGISRWKIQEWDIPASRAQAIMFAPHPGETAGGA